MLGQGQGRLGRDRSVIRYQVFFLHSDLPSEMSKLEIRSHFHSVVLNETKLQAFRTSVTCWRWSILIPSKTQQSDAFHIRLAHHAVNFGSWQGHSRVDAAGVA
jgi:hypothetical protein